MLNSVKTRGLALLATVALLGGTAWIASGTTGAYFSDTHTGAISGSIGTIQIAANGDTGKALSNLSFTNLMPGEAQAVTINYKNTGTSAQDVWITFPNATALSALNDLGSFGEVHLYSNGAAVFQSANLDDHTDTCSDPVLCKPLPKQVVIARNVAPNATGTITFQFKYSIALDNNSQGTAFNRYPVPSQFHGSTDTTHGTGLPFAIVAMQRGQQPS